MAYVSVPKDLTKVKSKVLFHLTKRQLLCFSCGALIGVPLFFLLKQPLGTSPAIMCMMVALLPAMLFALYEHNGQPLEVVLRQIVRAVFLRPRVRPYRTDNFYFSLLREENLKQEVYRIVPKGNAQRKQKTIASRKKTDPGGKTRDQKRHRKSKTG